MARKRNQNDPNITAADKTGFLQFDISEVSFIEAAPAADGKPNPNPACDITAYTGGELRIGWDAPVVLEFSGIQHKRKIPLLYEHDRKTPVGHGTPEISATGIRVPGQLIEADDPTSKSAKLVRAQRQGYPWEASVGVLAQQSEFLRPGKQAVVNGRQFTGPVYIVRKSKLREVSFVSIGADDDTSSRIAATGATDMTFLEWLQANHPDKDIAKLTATEFITLSAEFEKSHRAGAGDGSLPVSPDPAPNAAPAAAPVAPVAATATTVPATAPAAPAAHLNATQPPATDPYQEALATQARARKRVSEIEVLCSGRDDIAAMVLEDEAKGAPWSEQQIKDRVALANLQDGRPDPPGLSLGDHKVAQKTIECAMCLGFGEELISEGELVEGYGEKVVEAAGQYRGIGLRGAIELMAQAKGQHMPHYTPANDQQWVEAAVSLGDLPNMFKATFERTLLSLYARRPPIGPQVTRNGSVPDFRQVTRFALDGGEPWKPVGRDGRLERRTYADETPYTVQAGTYGEILSFRREDRINDDLSAIPQVVELQQRGALHLIDQMLMLQLLLKANYSASLGLYKTGAAEAFSYSALDTAWDRMVGKFRNTTRTAKLKSRIRPRFLINSLEDEKTVERTLNPAAFALSPDSTSTADTLVNAENYFRSRLTPHTFEEMDNDTWFPGAATSTHYAAKSGNWFLLAPPDHRYAPLEYSWLNGKRTPTTESAQAPFENLGFEIRSYIDVGIDILEAVGIQFMQPVA